MDRAAIGLCKILEADPPEDGKPGYSLAERMKAFDAAQGWLAKRQKLKPEAEQPDDAGITLLREMMANPTATVEQLHDNPEFRGALIARGWLAPPPKKNGRPTKEEAAERRAYEAEIQRRESAATDAAGDDSEPQRILQKGG